MLGNAENNLAARLEGAAVRQHRSAAITAYRLALEVYTRTDFPQDWAMTQTNLAVAFSYQAVATTEKSESLRLRREAVSCAVSALQVRTKEHFPDQHQKTQNLLDTLRRELAEAEAAEKQ